jgi:hypothetical protein
MSRFPLGLWTLPLSLFGLRFAQAGAPPPVFGAFAAPHGDFSARFFLARTVWAAAKTNVIKPHESRIGDHCFILYENSTKHDATSK